MQTPQANIETLSSFVQAATATNRCSCVLCILLCRCPAGLRWSESASGLQTAHASVCPLRREKCSSCSQKMLSVKLASHRAEQCSHRSVQCDKCHQSMLFHELAAHQADKATSLGYQTCCGGSVFCPNDCKAPDDSPAAFAKVDLQKHLAFECHLRTNACVKCRGEILWSEMKEHLADRCIERIVECRHCAAILSFGTLQKDHLRKEKNGAAACVNTHMCANEGCTHAHRKEAAEKHAAECERRLVDCPCCSPPVAVRHKANIT